jgi:hypothetical protein
MRTDLVANVLDLSGDQLDEIVLWDEKRTAPKTAPSTEVGSMHQCATPITTSRTIGQTCRCRPAAKSRRSVEPGTLAGAAPHVS